MILVPQIEKFILLWLVASLLFSSVEAAKWTLFVIDIGFCFWLLLARRRRIRDWIALSIFCMLLGPYFVRAITNGDIINPASIEIYFNLFFFYLVVQAFENYGPLISERAELVFVLIILIGIIFLWVPVVDFLYYLAFSLQLLVFYLGQQKRRLKISLIFIFLIAVIANSKAGFILGLVFSCALLKELSLYRFLIFICVFPIFLGLSVAGLSSREIFDLTLYGNVFQIDSGRLAYWIIWYQESDLWHILFGHGIGSALVVNSQYSGFEWYASPKVISTIGELAFGFSATGDLRSESVHSSLLKVFWDFGLLGSLLWFLAFGRNLRNLAFLPAVAISFLICVQPVLASREFINSLILIRLFFLPTTGVKRR